MRVFQVSSRDENDQNKSSNRNSKNYSEPKIVGTIKTKEIDESSGLAASKCTEDVFWTHNDSGDGAYIFALDSNGEKLATYKVKNADNNDWEDIAEIKDSNGECFLYIGDIGNNSRTKPVQTRLSRQRADGFFKRFEQKKSVADRRCRSI